MSAVRKSFQVFKNNQQAGFSPTHLPTRFLHVGPWLRCPRVNDYSPMLISCSTPTGGYGISITHHDVGARIPRPPVNHREWLASPCGDPFSYYPTREFVACGDLDTQVRYVIGYVMIRSGFRQYRNATTRFTLRLTRKTRLTTILWQCRTAAGRKLVFKEQDDDKTTPAISLSTIGYPSIVTTAHKPYAYRHPKIKEQMREEVNAATQAGIPPNDSRLE